MLEVYREEFKKIRAKLGELNREEITGDFKERFAKMHQIHSLTTTVEPSRCTKTYEISKDRLEILNHKVLGSGQFGHVLQATLRSEHNNDDRILVAVKTLKPNVVDVDRELKKALLLELEIMCFVGKHENIVSLMGAVTHNFPKGELFIALEYCPNGDLLTYIRNQKLNFIDLFIHNQNIIINKDLHSSGSNKYIEGKTGAKISTLDLLTWARQISTGMTYISSRNVRVIHGDLAARNILLTQANVAKISDFGLAHQLANNHNATENMKQYDTPLPWRWMAIESLRDMTFSLQSDVWSFGVTLYEIFTMGSTPYSGINCSHDFPDNLLNGVVRLDVPEFANNEIYTLMNVCMKKEPLQRTDFFNISHVLQSIQYKLLIRHDEEV